MTDNMTLMARSILRHEDELSQQRTHREFLLTVEQGSAGLLPIMYRQSMEWKKLKDSTRVNGPLRLHLFNSMMQSWKQRVETRMREPKCLILYRAMMAMCGNGSSKVINMRVRPVKMERQPLLKILGERFPPRAWAEEDKKKGGGTGSGHQHQ